MKAGTPAATPTKQRHKEDFLDYVDGALPR
jgi:hypothetical protein